MSDVTTAEFNEEGKYLRKVRSFVLREGRLTKGQATAMEEQWPLMGLDYSLSHWIWQKFLVAKPTLY